jgi:two-component system, OmpR family, phosphate regulon response regulator PhoB
MSALILVVDEDLAMQELVAVNLTRAGHRVVRAEDATRARSCMHAELPDLVVLEWSLPGMSGIDLVRTVRSELRTRALPLIMLTERLDVRDKIAGLEAGADDYVTKPFSPRELLARIAAVLRRRAPQSIYDAVEMCGLRIEPIAKRVTVDGAEVDLGATEFRLLHFLMTHANRVHSRTHLLDQVWGDHFFGEERTVDVHIRRLRAAIRKGGHDALIQTVRGTGYSFWAEGQ